MLKPTLDAKQLAEVLHLKPYTVTDYTIRHPEWLPPSIKLPTGKPLWFEEDVQAWLEERRIKVLPPLLNSRGSCPANSGDMFYASADARRLKPQRSPTDFSRKWW